MVIWFYKFVKLCMKQLFKGQFFYAVVGGQSSCDIQIEVINFKKYHTAIVDVVLPDRVEAAEDEMWLHGHPALGHAPAPHEGVGLLEGGVLGAEQEVVKVSVVVLRGRVQPTFVEFL